MRGSRAAAFLAAAALIAAGGCQLSYFLMGKEPKKKVAAEYDKLADKSVALVVWCDQATLDMDYAARFRVGDSVRYYVKEAVPTIKFVDLRDITEFQEREGSGWESLSNSELGRKFKADIVLRVDLLEYTARASDERSVRRGSIRATVNVYELGSPQADTPVYSTEIASTYPEDARIDTLNMSELDILNGAARKFGELAAQKFHEHEVSY